MLMKKTIWLLIILILSGCSNRFKSQVAAFDNYKEDNLNIAKLFNSKSYKNHKKEVIVEYYPSIDEPTSIVYTETHKDGLSIGIQGSKGVMFRKGITNPDNLVEDVYYYTGSGKFSGKVQEFIGKLYKDSLKTGYRMGYRVPVGKSYTYDEDNNLIEYDHEQGFSITVYDLPDIVKKEGVDFDKQVFGISRTTGQLFAKLLEAQGINHSDIKKYWHLKIKEEKSMYYFLVDGTTGKIVLKGSLILRDS